MSWEFETAPVFSILHYSSDIKKFFKPNNKNDEVNKNDKLNEKMNKSKAD